MRARTRQMAPSLITQAQPGRAGCQDHGRRIRPAASSVHFTGPGEAGVVHRVLWNLRHEPPPLGGAFAQAPGGEEGGGMIAALPGSAAADCAAGPMGVAWHVHRYRASGSRAFDPYGGSTQRSGQTSDHARAVPSARGISPRCIRSAAKGGSTDQSIESRTGVTSPDSATQHAGSRLQRQRFAPGHAVRTDCRTAAHARGIEKERWSRKILMATRSEEKHLSLVPLGCLCLPKSRLPANPARPTGDLKALGGSVSDGRPKDACVRLARLNGCNEFRVPGNR